MMRSRVGRSRLGKPCVKWRGADFATKNTVLHVIACLSMFKPSPSFEFFVFLVAESQTQSSASMNSVAGCDSAGNRLEAVKKPYATALALDEQPLTGLIHFLRLKLFRLRECLHPPDAVQTG